MAEKKTKTVKETKTAEEPAKSAQETQQPPLNAKEELSEFFKTAMIAILLALFIRTFLFEPFNIPSGSMKPTLEVGDYLFVYKPSYGFSRYSFPFGIAPIEGRLSPKPPKRGDVVVFKLPSNPSVDYIKRVVALPGESVQVRDGRLYINDEIVEREPVGLRRVPTAGRGDVTMVEYIETLPGNVIHRIYEETDAEPLDNTKVYNVPENHYFVMGDNRDNSQDSRVMKMVGYVPYENLVGRADFLFFSINGEVALHEVWRWPWAVRYKRLLKSLAPVRPDMEADVMNAAAQTANKETGNAAR